MKKKAKHERRFFSPQERESHVQGWQSSGLSARAYGERVGVRAGNLTRWSRKSSAPSGQVAPAFCELALRGGDGTLTPNLTPEAQQPHGPLLDVFFPSGLRLVAHREVEAEWLKSVIQAVDEVRR